MPNSLLLAHLAAASDDETVVRAMSSAAFGLTGEFGEGGFGATTLEDHLVLFTHPEFYAVAGLPPGLQAVEANAKQVADYARTVGLAGFVLNPGTHQRFLSGNAIRRLESPLLAPDLPPVPPLFAWTDPPQAVLEAVVDAARDSAVGAVWLGREGVVATHPHPDPAFEAALLARDVRLRSYGASPSWEPVFRRDAPTVARFRLSALRQPLSATLTRDLIDLAERHSLSELWAFEASIQDASPALAFAYTPHPNNLFAAAFDDLHARHALGGDSPLLDAETLREALPRMGMRLR